MFEPTKNLEANGYMYCFCYDKYKKDLSDGTKRQAAIDFKFEKKHTFKVMKDGKMVDTNQHC